MKKNKKNWTGERLETYIHNETMVEHLHRYAFALEFVNNKIVLDIASGEGYGSNILSKNAKKVFGVDVDFPTIEAAKSKYKSSNLKFIQGSADKIPLADNLVDVVVSFETIEHHDKHLEMIQEVKRVLKPDGMLIISSPDKRYYTDEPNTKNPFHVKELYENEFKALINSYFNYTLYLKQNFLISSIFFST
ncbi:MAG: class I SAM-dependent methyltransferase, partial [Pedobacter sp.]